MESKGVFNSFIYQPLVARQQTPDCDTVAKLKPNMAPNKSLRWLVVSVGVASMNDPIALVTQHLPAQLGAAVVAGVVSIAATSKRVRETVSWV